MHRIYAESGWHLGPRLNFDAPITCFDEQKGHRVNYGAPIWSAPGATIPPAALCMRLYPDNQIFLRSRPKNITMSMPIDLYFYSYIRNKIK